MSANIKPLLSISGVVIHGRGLGRTVGMPTANIDYNLDGLKLEHGVYACVITVFGKKHFSITNLGTKPTISDNDLPNIETHILNFDKDIYGETVTLEIFKFIRNIKKFNNLQEVKNQTEKDKITALNFFKEKQFSLVATVADF